MMRTGNELAKLTNATRILAEAKTLEEVKNIVDIAEAARVYAKAAKLGLEIYNHAAEVKVRAERKAGEMLAQLERDNNFHGNQAVIGQLVQSPSKYKEVLDDNQIGYKSASRWQQLANMPDDLFEKRIEEKRGESPITTTGIFREVVRQSRKPIIPPDGKYRIIYADPPWTYGNTMPEGFIEQRDHYPTMSMEDICDLPIKELAGENAVLFLWVTSPILEEASRVINSWGFEYKSSFVWDKVKHVMGHYNSVRHELLLVCVRGSCQPDVHKLFDSVYTEERTDHSRKPEYFRNVIDTIYPVGKRIELFARSRHDNWDTWGNEIS